MVRVWEQQWNVICEQVSVQMTQATEHWISRNPYAERLSVMICWMACRPKPASLIPRFIVSLTMAIAASRYFLKIDRSAIIRKKRDAILQVHLTVCNAESEETTKFWKDNIA